MPPRLDKTICVVVTVSVCCECAYRRRVGKVYNLWTRTHRCTAMLVLAVCLSLRQCIRQRWLLSNIHLIFDCSLPQCTHLFGFTQSIIMMVSPGQHCNYVIKYRMLTLHKQCITQLHEGHFSSFYRSIWSWSVWLCIRCLVPAAGLFPLFSLDPLLRSVKSQTQRKCHY